jgi:phosphomannomutase
VKKIIFTISGLRGIFGDNLTPELVMQYALRFGKYLLGKNVAVGRDTRPSGETLFYATVSGLFYAGCNVYDFGICPTPAIVKMVKELGLDGGIEITASHNPEQWNGLKFISAKGKFLFPSELQEFKKQLRNKRENFHLKVFPRFIKKEIIEQYLQNIITNTYFKKIPNKNFRVGIDSCNGAAEDAAVRLVEMLGAIPVTIKKSGFPRPAEPKAENLKRLCSEVKKQKLDFGIAFDPDGDRFSCVDELGIPLSEEATILLALLFILEQNKGPVVVNNSTTMAVDDICKTFGVPLYRSKTGEINVVVKMQEVGAIVGGEGNGGVIVPAINFTRDGLVATAILLKLLSKRNCPLSAIRKELPIYFMDKTEVSDYRDEWQKIIRKKFATDSTIKFDTQDGLKIIGKNFWVLTRKSNTEPILRIIAESENKSITDRLIRDTIDQIKIRS